MLHSRHYAHYLAACRSGLRAEARLGSPRLRNCAGIGICSIHPAGPPVAGARCNSSLPAFVRLDQVTGRLLVHIEAEGIPPMVLRRHFGDGMLRATASCRLSPEIAEALDLSEEPLFIAAGNYPVLDDGTFLTLSLALTRDAALSPGVLRSAA